MEPLPVDRLLEELRAPLHQLPQISKDFETTFHHLALASTSQFLPTPVTELPDGSEMGEFLALDLGGSNLRVAVIELIGSSGIVNAESHEGMKGRVKIALQGRWVIEEGLKSGAAELLFGWVAERIGDTITEHLKLVSHEKAERLLRGGIEMGITFSFPMEQSSHTSAVLISMGKGFTFKSTNDLPTLLQTAYTSHAATLQVTLPKLHIVAITNDSIATLLSTAYVYRDTHTYVAAGIIAGTGTNATCLCPSSKLSASKRSLGASTVLVNTEWSINGTLPPIELFRTAWDKQLDAANEKPGFQPFEEMVGGRYIGELVRLAVVNCFSKGQPVPEGLQTPYAVETKLCSEVEAANSLDEAQVLLREYFQNPEFWTLERTSVFQRVADAVSGRAAALVVAATVGLLGVHQELDGEVRVVIGYTGTVLEKYYRFRERCQRFLDELLGKGRVELVGALDGGMVGAAVLAAMLKASTT